MSTNSTVTALRVLPANVPAADDGPPAGVSKPPGVHGLNTLRAVSDYAPSELTELDDEITELLERADKLQFRRQYLTRLLGVANEFYELRER